MPCDIPGCYSFGIPEDPSLQRRVADFSEDTALFVEPSEGAGLIPFFFADGGLVIAALALGIEEADTVLDTSAAPGATSAVLASFLFRRLWLGREMPENYFGRLVCNEASKSRAARMQETLQAYVPACLLDSNRPRGPHVVFTSTELGTTSNTVERYGPYDKIFLHGPCTDDRKLLRGFASGLANWTAGAPKAAAERVLKALYSALWTLKEEGVLLYYSTALSHEECDGVMERLLRKSMGKFELEVTPLQEQVGKMIPLAAVENTDWGVRILPDKTPYPPVYLSRVRLLRRTHEAADFAIG